MVQAHSRSAQVDAVPGPKGLPVVGSPWMVGYDPLVSLPRIARSYGDLARFKVGRRRVYVVSRPDLIEEVWVRQRDKTRKDTVTRELSGVLGNGLLTSEGAHWKRQRRAIAPSFQPRHLAGYADAMVRSTAERMPEPGTLDVHELSAAITLDIVIRTLFGAEPSGEAGRVGSLLADLMGAFEVEQRTFWRFVPDWLPGPHRAKVERVRTELDALVMHLVDQGRTRGDADDLLCRLLAARDDQGHGMSDLELRDELVTLFLAGHETTALAVSFALWMLAEHPEVQERVLAEVDALDGTPTMADLRRMPQLDAVLKETLRLYPPAWATGREALEDIELSEGVIPAGAQAVASQWVVHRDPRWWTGASRFRPERWTNGETADLPRMAYFPFGGGERVCVGNHFANMEAMLVLATFLQQRWVAAVPGYAPDLVPAVTLRPRNGVVLQVQGR
ncbi:MAG: cytochrome P450 [Alphaproteobacteria bacterium]|nr:cytochrome P450 [Alphaproteobacteria bacterium]